MKISKGIEVTHSFKITSKMNEAKGPLSHSNGCLRSRWFTLQTILVKRRYHLCTSHTCLQVIKSKERISNVYNTSDRVVFKYTTTYKMNQFTCKLVTLVFVSEKLQPRMLVTISNCIGFTRVHVTLYV